MRTAAHHPQLLGAYVMDALDRAERHAVEEHLVGCRPCRSEVADLEQVRDVLGDLPPEALIQGPPDADLVLARTLRRMRAETTASTRRRRALVAAGAVVLLAGA
ncbi:zf-HC2 domain-containing protein, partial [Micromonospora zhanjiangensis]